MWLTLLIVQLHNRALIEQVFVQLLYRIVQVMLESLFTGLVLLQSFFIFKVACRLVYSTLQPLLISYIFSADLGLLTGGTLHIRMQPQLVICYWQFVFAYNLIRGLEWHYIHKINIIMLTYDRAVSFGDHPRTSFFFCQNVAVVLLSGGVYGHSRASSGKLQRVYRLLTL